MDLMRTGTRINPLNIEGTNMLSHVEEDKQLTQFWKIEEVRTDQSVSTENKHCKNGVRKFR